MVTDPLLYVLQNYGTDFHTVYGMARNSGHALDHNHMR